MNIEQMKDRSEKMLKELKMERDDLKVQLHLLSMDVTEEWNELESKYEKFKAKSSEVADVAGDSAGDVLEALKLVGDELREGYNRIRRSM